MAYEHHIGNDGSGYPQVPQDWKLNLASRIVQVVDIFDALRTNRPYRKGLSVPEIVQIMENQRAVSLDSDLLDIFLQFIAPRNNPAPTGLVEV